MENETKTILEALCKGLSEEDSQKFREMYEEYSINNILGDKFLSTISMGKINDLFSKSGINLEKIKELYHSRKNIGNAIEEYFDIAKDEYLIASIWKDEKIKNPFYTEERMQSLEKYKKNFNLSKNIYEKLKMKQPVYKGGYSIEDFLFKKDLKDKKTPEKTTLGYTIPSQYQYSNFK